MSIFNSDEVLITDVLINNTIGISSIHVQNSYIYIDSSVFSACFSMYTGGCVSANDSSVIITKTIFEHSKSTIEGGAVAIISNNNMSKYLCVILKNNTYLNNSANSFGGAIYIEGYNTSCMSIVHNTFESNTAEYGNSMYLNMINMLSNQAFILGICNINNMYCSDFSSSLTYLCAVGDLLALRKCKNDKTNTTFQWPQIYTHPGSLETVYVYGYDVFRNRIIANNFHVSALSLSSNVHIPWPQGSAFARDIFAKFIPITIVSGLNKTEGVIIVNDQNAIANKYYINITIQDCNDNQYKKIDKTDSGIFECVDCSFGTYTVNNGECKSCDNLIGVECESNNIKLERNHYATIMNDTLHSSICPLGYCCRKTGGCFLSDIETICGTNRDPSVWICGKCKKGYSETSSNTGNCSKCENRWWLLPICTMCGYLVVYILFKISQQERSVPDPFATYCSKTLLFYYQTLVFVNFDSHIPILNTVTDIFSLNLFAASSDQCFYVNNVDARQKLYLTLTIPAILIISLAIEFAKYYITKRMSNPKKIKKSTTIAFQSVFSILIRILYLQLIYTFIRLSICQHHLGEYYLWYAGNVECFDKQHFVAVVLFVFIFAVPFLLLSVQRYYKDVYPHRFEELFSSTILSYRPSCWYYEIIELLQRSIIVICSVSTLPSWMIASTGFMLILHCALMPYRWRANNFLECFVRMVIFAAAVLNASEKRPSVGTTTFNLESIPLILSILPLIPVPWLFYECNGNWVKSWISKLKNPHCKIIGQNYVSVPLASNSNIEMSLRNSSAFNDHKFDDKTEEKDKIATSTINAKLTRSGWKYPFKLMQWQNRNKYSSGNRRVHMTLIIQFSNEIPESTFIDFADLSQHLNYHTMDLGCSIIVTTIRGKGREFRVGFDAKWKNFDKLSQILSDLSDIPHMHEVIMETAIFNSFYDNDELKTDLTSSFKLYAELNNVKIDRIKIEGTMNEVARNEKIMEKLLLKFKSDVKKLQTSVQQIVHKPLHQWSPTDLCNRIESWLLNDIVFQKNMQSLMEIMSNKLLSGKKIVSEHNKNKLADLVKKILKRGSPSEIYDELNSLIMAKERYIISATAPEIAMTISKNPLNLLLKRIQKEGEEIDGKRFIDTQNYKWMDIMQKSGWNLEFDSDEINQIKTVILRNMTHKRECIVGKLKSYRNDIDEMSLNVNLSKLWNNVMQSMESEDIIDFGVLQLKLRNGYSIQEEVKKLKHKISTLQDEEAKDTIDDD
eukprot:472096_1